MDRKYLGKNHSHKDDDNSNNNGALTEHQAMKAYWGSEGKLHSFDLGTRWA
jgi:hypothetical protein